MGGKADVKDLDRAPVGEPVSPDYEDYLRDESRLSGTADRIVFPREEEEVRGFLRSCASDGGLVTVQGARTGITGGAVPRGGLILNLSRMNRMMGLRSADEALVDGECYLLRVQPGVLLSEINEALEKRQLPTAGWDPSSLAALERMNQGSAVFFPPDPTETSASIGGMAATNASGARSFGYGPTRRYVYGLRMLLADGCAVTLRRGGARAAGRRLRLPTDCGREVNGDLPGYSMPSVKNAAGLYCCPDMELIDLAIGGEGTLGVLTELELLLIPRPQAVVGLMVFFPDEQAVVPFVSRLRAPARGTTAENGALLAAIEFFDPRSLRLLEQQRESNPAFAELPAAPSGNLAAVYVEIHGTGAEDRLLELGELLEECGGDTEATWLAESPPELARLKDFRHALPEAVNLVIDDRRRRIPGLTKLGTDMAVPDGALAHILERYRRDLAASGLEHVMFGHIGSNHVHVNIIPHSLEEYRKGRELYRGWAEEVVRLGGSVSAEHGVGKMKTDLLQLMYGSTSIREMAALIERFNPGRRLNRGNMVGST
jgi:D-lactate dehydrogenase (cytochrome)